MEGDASSSSAMYGTVAVPPGARESEAAAPAVARAERGARGRCARRAYSAVWTVATAGFVATAIVAGARSAASIGEEEPGDARRYHLTGAAAITARWAGYSDLASLRALETEAAAGADALAWPASGAAAAGPYATNGYGALVTGATGAP